MDTNRHSIYGKNGRILSFEEARCIFLENSNRQQQMSDPFQKQNPFLSYSQPFNQSPFSTEIVSPNPHPTQELSPLSSSQWKSTDEKSEMTPTSPLSVGEISPVSFQIQQPERKIAVANPVEVNYIPVDSNYVINEMHKQHKLQPQTRIEERAHKVLAGTNQITREFIRITLNLNKFFLFILIASVFMTVFSISMIVSLALLTPDNSKTLKAGFDLRNDLGFTTAVLPNTLPSPSMELAKTTTPMPGNTTNLDKFAHLPWIGSCFVNWTRLSFSWSYYNPVLDPHMLDAAKQREKSIVSQIKHYCLLKIVMREKKMSSSETILLPDDALLFDYYRGGFGDRHGNNVFIFALAPCFDDGSSAVFKMDNSHLSVNSNFSSLIVVAGPVTKKNYFCSSMYDVNDAKNHSSFNPEVMEKYKLFLDRCSNSCMHDNTIQE